MYIVLNLIMMSQINGKLRGNREQTKTRKELGFAGA